MEILPIGAVTASAGVLKAYQAVLASLHGPDFDMAVVEGFRASLAWERLYLFQGATLEAAGLRVARYEPSLAPIVPLYARRYLSRDPIRIAAAALDRDTHTVALRLEPADIAEEGYRNAFFVERGIIERISLLQRTDAGWRGVNIARHRRQGLCSPDELSAMAALGQLILPIVDRHYEAPAPPAWRDSLRQIEDRFLHAYPVLTVRERQVCARAAVGMSVEATAIDLGIGRTSVLTYRRRAYGRLGVSSPYGLAALVLH